MEIALSTASPSSPTIRRKHGFAAESATSSSNTLALLASLTLQKALKVNTNNNYYVKQLTASYQQHQLFPEHQSQQLVNQVDRGTLGQVGSTTMSSTSTTTTKYNTIVAKQQSPPLPKATETNTTSISNTESTTSSTTTTTTTITGKGNGVGSNSSSIINNKHIYKIPSDILDDLASRFIINVPDMELSNLIRICFQIELAHWFYLDFFCSSEEVGKRLQPCGMKQFALQLFQHIPFLTEHLSSIDKILEDWKNYKLSVPTYGAILISEDLKFCLLVQSYFAKSSWGFPKGKVNENENPEHCAAREVYEETGYDITELIVPNDYIEAVINYQYTRLYIVRNVSLNTQFSPRTRNEIKCCDWFPIDSLPINKNDAISKAKLGINANSFFMIMPFVKRLKKWVIDVQQEQQQQPQQRRKFQNGCTSTNSSMIVGISPKSPSPLTLTTSSALGTYNNSSNNNNSAGNQKQLTIGVSSGKKMKQQQKFSHNIDEKKGLSSLVTGGETAAEESIMNRSKRQRHKSMGDLDGTNLNNNSITNAKTDVNGGKIIVSVQGNAISNEVNGNVGNNHKRNSTKIVAAGSNSNNNNANGGTSTKRQLLHSQSQSGVQQQNGDKPISSFELIRKEKQQQLKAAKAQKQQHLLVQGLQQHGQAIPQKTLQDTSNSSRVRAKSQGDKANLQQQPQQPQQSPQQYNGKYNGSTNNKQRVQKQQLQQQMQTQQTIIINNSANAVEKSTHSSAVLKKAQISEQPASPIPTSFTGEQLIAFAAAAIAATPSRESANASSSRPASVHLDSELLTPSNNLRILKRSSTQLPMLMQQQSPQLHHQHLQLEQQLQPIKLTPSFNSWTNFSFTKNFITNVFC